MGYLSFTSVWFILFLIVCTAGYYLIPKRFRWIVLLASSILFYLSAGIEELPFILAASVIIWFAACMMGKAYAAAELDADEKEFNSKDKMLFMASVKKRCRNHFLLPAVIVMLAVLIYCKFAQKMLEAFCQVASLSSISLNVIVPLGISYYTFSTIGYLLDVYWRKQQPIQNYFKFALCVFYFPQIVQGPIARYSRLSKELFLEHTFDYKNVCFGIQLMLYGYMKKMILADRLSVFTSAVFGNLNGYEGLVIVIALVFSTFQIYMDFSGCMDIVRGVSQIFGVVLDKNFDHPFFSKSTAEFWRRWHITLGTWFKDYVYLPVSISGWLMKLVTKIGKKSGKRAGKAVGVAVPLMIVWLLTGLWHGTGWNYVVWGIYFGVIIICGAVFADQYKMLAQKLHIDVNKKSYQIFQMIRTFCVYTIGRLITAPGTLQGTFTAVRQMFRCFNPWIFWDGTLYNMGLDFKDLCVVVIGLLIVREVSILQERGSVRQMIAERNIVLRWLIYYAAFFAIVIFGMYGAGYNAGDFIYVNF